MNGNNLGKKYSVSELFDILQRDIVFYDESGGGVTFSGGEPLSQADYLLEILKLCHTNGIQTAVDTSGYADKEAFDKILPFTDIFLYDLKLMDPDQHKKYTSVSNKKILENLTFLLNNQGNVIIRIPMIPDITSSKNNLMLIKEFLNGFNLRPEVNLLSYHRTATGKYEKLKIKNEMEGHRDLTKQEIEENIQFFVSSGYQVKLGG